MASTAAGPVFEGVGISQGMPSLPAAIDRVEAIDGNLIAHTIVEVESAGICSSGIMDAVSSLIKLGLVDETGAMKQESINITSYVSVTRKDIRAVQLGKAAISAGIHTLLQTADCTIDDVKKVYLAGGFGSNLHPESAAGIGLFPSLRTRRIQPLENAAVMGAEMLLLAPNAREEIRQIREKSLHVDLGGNAVFLDLFIENMSYENCWG